VVAGALPNVRNRDWSPGHNPAKHPDRRRERALGSRLRMALKYEDTAKEPGSPVNSRAILSPSRPALKGTGVDLPL